MSLEILISKNNIQAAKKRYKNFKKSRQTVYGGSRLHGIIAEEIFLQNFGGKLVDNNIYDIDYPGLGKIDIKCKRTKRPPKPTHMCTVYGYQTKKEIDYYVFCSVLEDLSKMWILGAESQKGFLQNSTFYKKGDKQTERFLVWEDSYCMEIGKLRDVREILYESD